MHFTSSNPDLHVSLPNSRPRLRLLPYALTAALCALMLPVTLVFPNAHDHPVFLFFLTAVAISAWGGGWLTGALAVAITTAELAIWVFPPLRSLRISAAEHMSRFISFVATAILTLIVFARLRASEHRNRKLLATERELREETERAAMRLQQSERQLQEIIDGAPETVVFLKDVDGHFITINRTLETLLGITREELQGKTDYDVFPEHRADQYRKDDQRVLATGRSVQLEEVALMADGIEHVFLTNKFPLLDGDGKAYAVCGISADITGRKQTEEALIRTEKLASMGRLAATIAHEINNPLAAVMNSLYIARTSAVLPQTLRPYLDVADEELRRVSHITRQALGFYRESTAPTLVAVSEVLESTLDLLKSKIKAKHANVEKAYDPQLQVIAVAGELRQVISNLLSNSLDAIEDHGTIKLRVSTAGANSGNLSVRLTVADNGRGIDAVVRPRVFDPLFTTKASLGTGLGLWVSKQIVQKHGGSIRVHSSVNGTRRGTTFSILLPAAARPAKAAEQPVPAKGRAMLPFPKTG